MEPGVGTPVVRAASREARTRGVRAGLRRREAEARCPGLITVDVDPEGEARAFEVVARAIETLTPRLELDRPGLLAFPTRGPSRYFGGDEALAGRVVTAVAEVGIADVRVGIADGELAARLAARGSGPGATRVVAPGRSAEFLGGWPVGALRLTTGRGGAGGDGVEADALVDLLVRLGLPTLGEFAGLPEAAVTGRFGATGRRAHRLARGLDEHPPALGAAPVDLVESEELDPPVTRLDAAAFSAKAMADRLAARLADAGLACVQVAIETETEHGERLVRSWRRGGSETGGLDATTLADRVRWQLEGWLGTGSITGGLTSLHLTPEVVVPATGRQLGFWGGDPAAADRAARALARVQGLLGPEAATTPVLQGGRAPAERVRFVPWGEPREPWRDVESAWPGRVPPPAPARVHEPPRPAELLDVDGRPVVVSGRGECGAPPAWLRSDLLPSGQSRVVAWAGPWPEHLRWWDRLARRRRARWQVCTDDGVAALVVLEAGRAGVEAVYD